jgi:hypothetical protein
MSEGDEVEISKQGGKGSRLDGWFSLIPMLALEEIGKVMKYGAKYGVNNWHNVPITTDGQAAGHIDHAALHIINYLNGKGDPVEELSHGCTRLLMALDNHLRSRGV